MEKMIKEVREVTITRNIHDEHYIWESQVGGSFRITRDVHGETLGRGTKIPLFLREEHVKHLSILFPFGCQENVCEES